jgi:hypothetical protein
MIRSLLPPSPTPYLSPTPPSPPQTPRFQVETILPLSLPNENLDLDNERKKARKENIWVIFLKNIYLLTSDLFER